MNNSNIRKFFSYSWYIDPNETDITCIRVYGLDNKNRNICLRIDDFTPYIYLELPDNIDWKQNGQLLGNKIDDIMKEQKPLKKSVVYKHKLYGAHINKDNTKKLFPYLFCSFATKEDIKKLGWVVRKSVYVLGVGNIKMKMHEQDAKEILQLVCCKNIPTAGWMKFIGEEVKGDDKLTICDKEYIVKSNKIKRYDLSSIPNPKIMGFDIEVNSTNPSAMPNAKKQGDKIFQISCVITIEGSGIYFSHILTLGQVDENAFDENTKAHMFETEAELLEGFTKLVRLENPNLLVGYNILGFDIQYMIDRAKSDYTHYCINNFDVMGFHKYNHSNEDKISWSSSAYKNQEFKFLDAEGRVFVDLLPIIQRDYKFNNYKLSTVSKEILNDDKKDLSYKAVFKCYRIGTKKESDGSYCKSAKSAMTVCAKYCIQDSMLVVKLLEKTKCWVSLCEMANTCLIPIFEVFTQGQQNKVYRQVYKYCMENKIVFEKDAYFTKENERYVGAHVFPPIPGIYNRVLPFDFCLAGDTLVSMSNGTSKYIKDLISDQFLIGYNTEDKKFKNYFSINGLQKKGVRDTVKIFLETGKTIIATPDHKFMLENGDWCIAKDLKGKSVKSGVEYTLDNVCELENNWSLKVDGYFFNTKNIQERDKSLAFVRILGYILSNGLIYIQKSLNGIIYCVEGSFNTLIDVQNFNLDVVKLSGINVIVHKKQSVHTYMGIKGVTIQITLPLILAKMIHSIEDIIVGKRSTHNMKLPKFILDDNCPLSIVREFLGGLYGGGGTSPYLKTDNFGSISFKLTVVEKYLKSTVNVFKQLKFLHKKLGIYTKLYEPEFVK